MAINRWTEDETKRALYLYFQLPFGQLHSGNPEIVELAGKLGRTPSSIAMKLANFASLDPKITESGRKGLTGATALDRQIWAAFNEDWTSLIMTAETLSNSDNANDHTVKERVYEYVHEPLAGPSSMTAVIEQRIGQNFFRRAVLANYDNRCCITGIDEPRLLNASHIIPWSSDVRNRHNPTNGLSLSATFDRAFDRGLMGVDSAGKVHFSNKLLNSKNADTRSFFEPYRGRSLLAAVRYDPNPKFLSWHFDNRFKSQEAHV